MFYDQITIDPVVTPLYLPFIATLIFVLMAVIALALFLRRRRLVQQGSHKSTIRKNDGLLLAVTAPLLIAGLVAISIYAVSLDKNRHEVRDRQLTAMIEQLGYNPVTIKPADDGSLTIYTARDSDGQYVSGELVEIDPGVYILKADEY